MNAMKKIVMVVFCLAATLVTGVAGAETIDVVTNLYLTTEWAPVYEGCDMDEVALKGATGMGGYLGPNAGMAPFFEERTATSLTVQYQVYDGSQFVKGLICAFKVEDNVLYARAVDAYYYSANTSTAVGSKDFRDGASPGKVATTPQSPGYGIKQLQFSVTPLQGIKVVGNPENFGTPDHDGWGTNGGLEVGHEYTFNAPDDGVNESGDTAWTCTGWTFVDRDGEMTSGSGRSFNFTYQKKGTLTWRFAPSYAVAFVGENCSFDTNKLWYARGERVSVTCTPAAGHAFSRWMCEDASLADVLSQNPITFVVVAPVRITAVIGEAISVAAGDDLGGKVKDAPSGSVIEVGDGIYEIDEEILIDRPLVLRSRNGAEKTVIRRTGVDKTVTDRAQRCLKMTSADGTVDGFTLTGGAAYSPNYMDTIESNTGCGAYLTAGTLSNCIVSNNLHLNTAGGGRGAGVAMMGGGTVMHCTIVGNGTANYVRRSYGGGVFMTGGRLADCDIRGNYLYSDVIEEGAGVYASGGDIVRCRLVGNMLLSGGSTSQGAGLFADGIAEVSDCLIAGNRAQMGAGKGGGLFANQKLVCRNCTIIDNTAQQGGGAKLQVRSLLYNCILQDNLSVAVDVDNNVSAQADSVFVNCLTPSPLTANATGTVTARALFADAANGDYRPKNVASPAVDAGSDADALSVVDLDGAVRKVGPVDIGCYELAWAENDLACEHTPESGIPGTVWTFTGFATSATAGRSLEWSWSVDGGAWSEWSAWPTLETSFSTEGDHVVTAKARVDGVETGVQVTDRVYVSAASITAEATAEGVLAALALAGDGSTVHVPAGDYTFDRTIVVDKGVILVGDAGAERTRFFRRTDVNVKDVSQRCLTIDHPDAVVRGITFSGGCNYSDNYVDFIEENSGAGVRISYRGGTLDSCVVTNCTFTQNRGVLAMEGPGVVTNCLIVDASCSAARFYGVGVYMSDGLVTHSTVLRAKGGSTYICYGAGVYMDGGALSHCRVLDCEIKSGSSGELGGGVYLARAAAKMDNCLVAGNKNNSTAGKGGGVAAVDGAQVVCCTIVGNEAKYGGGVYSSGAATFANCIIQGNDATMDAATKEYQGAKATYDHCLSPADFAGAAVSGCVKGTVEFNADYSLRSVSSPAVDKGNGAALDAAVQTDLAGNPRRSGEIDIGAFEFQKAEVEFGFEVSRLTKTTASSVTFTATVVTELEGERRYAWNFGDGWTDWSDNPVAAHTFTEPGRVAVALKVKIGERVFDSAAPTELAVAPSDVYVVDAATHPDWVPVAPYDKPEKAATDFFAALDAADDGTTVHLAAGLYPVDAEMIVKRQVVIRADEGRGTAVIRRSAAGTGSRVLTLDHAEARLEGLTITGGRINVGTIDVAADNCGGGIRIGANGGVVSGCVITNNSISYCGYGGGIAVQGPGVVSNCLVAANHCGSVRSVGRGVYLSKGATLADSEICGNDGEGTVWSVGAVYAVGARIVRCVISNNVDKSTVAHWGRSGGGGLYTEGEASYVENCLICRNTGYGVGGGIWSTVADSFVNCTVADNVNTKDGTVAAVNASGAATFARCLIAGVALDVSAEKATFDACYTGADPLFRNAAKGDFRLRSTSLARDVVLKRDLPADIPATDLLGNPRVFGIGLDAGCYESQAGGMMLLVK